jgi:hypothetical protein
MKTIKNKNTRKVIMPAAFNAFEKTAAVIVFGKILP